MICGTTRRTVLLGTAKPTPADAPEGLAICVLTPIRRPALSSSGPPELPVLMAASVWITSSIGVPSSPSMRRPRAETIPVVSVALRPKGLPIAYALCPTRSASLSATATGRSAEGGASMRSTARSCDAEPPTSSAS